MKIAIGCDQIVNDTKMKVSKKLKNQGHEEIDVGKDGFISTHYTIFGTKV
ncbi:RpiB/LacA/LacB family sugar-phosphate isomerase, partial [Staphylococcus haemolyticus]